MSDIRQIADLTVDEFISLLEEQSHQCLFGSVIVPDDARRVVDVIEEWGDGNFREGVEVMRENGKWVRRKRKEEAQEKQAVRNTVMRWLITGGLGVAALAAWEFLKNRLGA